jgi:kumamolisin
MQRGLFAALLAALAAGCGASDRTAIATSTPKTATPPPPPASTGTTADAGRLGPTRAGERVAFSLTLKIDEAALDAYLADVENPDSPRYHHYLSPGQYGARFGISRAQLARVEAAVRRGGLRTTGVPPQRTTLHVAGTAGRTNGFLHTTLVDYRDAEGRRYHRPEPVPTVPRALRGFVVGVSGLDTAPSVHPAPGAGAAVTLAPR